jgi:uncharacterized membrane protein YedE/YeeE
MSLRVSDALIVVAVLLVASWLIAIARNVQLPLGLPRNLLIWLALLAGGVSFGLSWRELSRKGKNPPDDDAPP